MPALVSPKNIVFWHCFVVKQVEAGLLSLKFAVYARSGSFKMVASRLLVVISSCSAPLRSMRQHEVIDIPLATIGKVFLR
jgi:hypothetical protein